jgi:hypothetical protein
VSRDVFEYAVVQAVPRAERGECLNVGVVLYCQARTSWPSQVHVDGRRLRVLDSGVDVDGVEQAPRRCSARATGHGPAGQTSLGQRLPVAHRAAQHRRAHWSGAQRPDGRPGPASCGVWSTPWCADPVR